MEIYLINLSHKSAEKFIKLHRNVNSLLLRKNFCDVMGTYCSETVMIKKLLFHLSIIDHLDITGMFHFET